MKRLILMRHAKSDWSAAVPDIERGLNPRGIASAAAIGDWLRAQGYAPDEVLCSAATRTQETLTGLRLAGAPALTLTRALYLAEPHEMLDILTKASGDTVLMLGHNPGSAMLAGALVDSPPEHANFARYPTCATLVVDFPIDSWSALQTGSGRVQDFIIPRALM